MDAFEVRHDLLNKKDGGHAPLEISFALPRLRSAGEVPQLEYPLDLANMIARPVCHGKTQEADEAKYSAQCEGAFQVVFNGEWVLRSVNVEATNDVFGMLVIAHEVSVEELLQLGAKPHPRCVRTPVGGGLLRCKQQRVVPRQFDGVLAAKRALQIAALVRKFFEHFASMHYPAQPDSRDEGMRADRQTITSANVCFEWRKLFSECLPLELPSVATLEGLLFTASGALEKEVELTAKAFRQDEKAAYTSSHETDY